MASAYRTTPETRFDTFTIHTTPYKTIGTHSINAYVLVPKLIDIVASHAQKKKHPVIVKWHGGGLTTGDGIYPDWFSSWLIPFAHRTSSILVCPNYRLVPESSGADLLSDVSDFQSWFRSTLPSYLSRVSPGLDLDHERVLLMGDSAGGWCALQSLLSEPQGTFRTSILQYPVVCAIPTLPDDILMGESIPPASELEEFMSNLKPGDVLSSAIPPSRSALAPMLRAHGKWGEVFGSEAHLMPNTRIHVQKPAFWVPMWIIHGKDDSNVPLKYTEEFAADVRNKVEGARIEIVAPAGDHGFDVECYEEDEEWLRDVLRGVEEAWLGE